MARTRLYPWTVRYEGAFPVDMLRVDGCWPETERGSHAIERSIEEKESGQVTLLTHTDTPTDQYWRSARAWVDSIERVG